MHMQGEMCSQKRQGKQKGNRKVFTFTKVRLTQYVEKDNRTSINDIRLVSKLESTGLKGQARKNYKIKKPINSKQLKGSSLPFTPKSCIYDSFPFPVCDNRITISSKFTVTAPKNLA